MRQSVLRYSRHGIKQNPGQAEEENIGETEIGAVRADCCHDLLVFQRNCNRRHLLTSGFWSISPFLLVNAAKNELGVLRTENEWLNIFLMVRGFRSSIEVYTIHPKARTCTW